MSTSLGDLLDRGVVVQAHEAVAIAQQLINERTTGLDSTAGPPSLGSVRLSSDGQAFAAGGDVAPSVFDVALLLQAMLPAEAGQVPGALRYAIARGLLDVEAPPFASLAEFSRGLERFERGDRREVVRGLIDRIPRAAPAAAPAVTAFEPEVVPAAAMAAPDDLDLESPALDLDLGREEILPVTVYARRPAQSYGALWAVAAVLVCAVTLAGVANIKHIGAFRPRLQTSAPQPGSNAAPQPVPDTVAGTVPRIVPGTESRTVPGVASHTVPDTVSGTTGADVPEPADAAGADLVSAVDAHQRPIFSPAFASNGAAMFFHTGTSSDEHSALAMVSGPIDGADLRVMTIVDDGARNYHVQPSPDGRLVAFDSDRDGERGVYLANRDGTGVRRISGPGYAAVPTWSPDGRRIAYVRAEPDHPRVWNLWLQDVESDHLTQLTSYRFGQPWSASWFPDDRRICYTHEDKIVLMDLETRRTWTFNSPMEGRQVRTPAVSPDGTKVIFQVRRDGAWILDLTDRSMRRVLTDPTAEEFAWAPDGRRIAFHSRRDGQWGIYILHQR